MFSGSIEEVIPVVLDRLLNAVELGGFGGSACTVQLVAEDFE